MCDDIRKTLLVCHDLTCPHNITGIEPTCSRKLVELDKKGQCKGEDK